MKVVNVSGITYAFMYKGKSIVIPYDERVYTLPDDIDTQQFGNSIRILVPPRIVVPVVPQYSVVIEEKPQNIFIPQYAVPDKSEPVSEVVDVDLDTFDFDDTKEFEIGENNDIILVETAIDTQITEVETLESVGAVEEAEGLKEADKPVIEEVKPKRTYTKKTVTEGEEKPKRKYTRSRVKKSFKAKQEKLKKEPTNG